MASSIHSLSSTSLNPADSNLNSTRTSQTSAPTALQNLTPSETKAFIEFKDLCDKEGQYWPSCKTTSSSSQPSNDDRTLLRYLRARQYDPRAALKQYAATISWRCSQNLDSTYDDSEIEAFEETCRMLPQWIGRRDKNGIPIFAYVVSAIRQDDLLATAKRDPELRCIFLPAENSMEFVMPLCARLRGGAVSTAVNIIDLSGVGVRHFWNLRSHLQKSSTMATAHYPETVERIFIIGAPSFFPTIWGFVVKWFDAATTAKINVLSAADVKPTLEKYIDVENIPKRYGGELEWDFNMHPVLDGEAKALMPEMAEKWVEGPLRYVRRDDEDVILAVGSEDTRTRREVVARMPSVVY